MASDRVVSFLTAHSSIASTVGAGIRDETIGSRPVAGRPRFFFWSTFIDFFMILVYHKSKPRGRASVFRPGSNSSHQRGSNGSS